MGSPYTTVSNGTPVMPYIQINQSVTRQQYAGDLRFNGSNNMIEVYDGNSWFQVHGGHAYVDLSSDVKDLLEWARKKKIEDDRLKDLASSNPTIKSLLEQIKQKEEQIKMVEILIQDEVKIGTN